MKNKLLFLLVIFHFSLLGQREADCFAVGYCDYYLPAGCTTPYGSAIYKFNEDGLEYIEEYAGLNLSTSYSRAAFSSRSAGELIFASNGWRLVNRSGQILAHKLWRDDIPHPGGTADTTDVLNTLGPLFLNDPGDSTKAYLFYGQRRVQDFPGIGLAGLDVLFTYAYLDIPTQSLISKSNVVLDEKELTLRADAAACRHANGRDWWLIKPGIYGDENYIGLLDPQGISIQKKSYPGLQHQVQIGHTWTYFNQIGDKLLRFVSLNSELHVFDFDRCSGELSNLTVHNLKDSLDILSVPDWNACTISPDGSKFYVRRSGRGTLQYDLETGVYTDLNYETSAPQLTPNYKQILFSTRTLENDTSIRTLSTMYEPNKPGLECNFVMHTDTIINIANFISPSCFANFRLGPLKGSPCDTIVSRVNEVKAKSLKVYPNPARDVLYVEFPSPNGKPYHIQIMDVMGRVVYTSTLSSEAANLSLAELKMNPGLYVLQAQREGKLYYKRFLIEK